MKPFITLSFLLVVAFASGQTKSGLPLTDFTIDLSEKSVVIKPGDVKQIVVSITRSKHYVKEKAILGLSSFLPKGVTVRFEPTEGNPEISNVILTVAHDADPGVYQLVVSATLNHKKKGTVLTLSVNNEPVAAK